MAFLEPVYAYRKTLLDNAGVFALTGSRIYSMLERPDNAKLPYVLYKSDSEEHENDLSGPSGGAMSYIDLYVFASSYTQLKTLITAIRKALDGLSGTVTVGTDSVVIEYSHLRDMNENPEIVKRRGESVSSALMQFECFTKTETS